MDLIFRALNEYDILCDPINNGIASKKIIMYDCTKKYLEAHENNFLSSK